MSVAAPRASDRDGRRTLANDQIEVTLDLDRGADIVSLVDRRSGIDVLFRTPWADRAEVVARRGSLLHHASSTEAWLESYAGGWQLLCPNAGPPVERAGVVHGFHGEAAVVPWTLTGEDAEELRLRVSLHTVPLTIERTLILAGPTVAIEDVVRNDAPVPVEFDYQHHPAFGAPLLAPEAVVETGARTFVADPDTAHWRFAPASVHAWPPRADGDEPLDRLPALSKPRVLLGWLADFDEPWAALRNPELDVAVALRWDGATMPYAWFWQELNGTPGYPWYGRTYAMAIEPSSTITGGPDRKPLRLGGGATLRTAMRATVCPGRSAIRMVHDDGTVEVEDD